MASCEARNRHFDWAGRLPGVVSGNVSSGYIDEIGHATVHDGTDDLISYAAKPAIGDADVTLAAIFTTDVVTSTARVLLTTSGTNAGFRLQRISSNLYFTLGGVADNNTGRTVATNTPYFFAVSYSAAGSSADVILVRLTDFAYAESTLSSLGTPTNGNGTFEIGGTSAFSGFEWDGAIALGAAIQRALRPDELRRWAFDPWAPLRPTHRKLRAKEVYIAGADDFVTKTGGEVILTRQAGDALVTKEAAASSALPMAMHSYRQRRAA